MVFDRVYDIFEDGHVVKTCQATAELINANTFFTAVEEGMVMEYRNNEAMTQVEVDRANYMEYMRGMQNRRGSN